MRLGEVLVNRRLVTRDQLRAALEEQRAFGKRLGTNCVQLGFLDVDALSRALGEQRGLNPTLRKHVAAIDSRVLSLFPARVVTAHKAIPLGYTTTKPARVIVACTDPATVPVEELAFAAGCRVDVWVAPELLMEESLEKYFGAPRAEARYIEVNFGPPPSTLPPASQRITADRPSSPGSSPGAPSARGAPASSPASRPSAASLQGSRPVLPGLTPPPPPPDAPIRAFTPPPPEPPSRASAPKLLSPPPPPPPPPTPLPPRSAPATPVPPAVRARPIAVPVLEPPRLPDGARPDLRSSPELPPDSGWDAMPSGRAAADELEAVDEPPPESEGPISGPADVLRPVIDQSEASRLLEMATSKERVGLVLADWLRSTFGCGLVLVVKGDVAVGWKGFFPDAEDLIEAVAVPLNRPSMFTPALAERPFCGAPAEDGMKANQLVWKLLRCPPPFEVIVCPVRISKRTVNLIYAHAADESPLTDTQFREAQVLAGDAGAAYMRIIRRERGERVK